MDASESVIEAISRSSDGSLREGKRKREREREKDRKKRLTLSRRLHLPVTSPGEFRFVRVPVASTDEEQEEEEDPLVLERRGKMRFFFFFSDFQIIIFHFVVATDGRCYSPFLFRRRYNRFF